MSKLLCNPLYRKKILFVLLSIIFLQSSSGAHCIGEDNDVFLFCRYKPAVLYTDGSISTTLEVHTTGEDIDEVFLVRWSSGFHQMYDDGTHGDEVSGDGVYTLNEIYIKSLYQQPEDPMFIHKQDMLKEIVIRKSSGEEEKHGVDPSLYLVDKGLSYPVTKYSDNLYATDYAFFIVDVEEDVLPDFPNTEFLCGTTFPEAYEKLYSVFPDEFDFIVVIPSVNLYKPNNDYRETVPYCVRVKNDIENIGLPIFSDAAEYGSDGRLRGVIYHSYGTGAILSHEVGHAWGIKYGEEFGLSNLRSHFVCNTDLNGDMTEFVFLFEDGSLSTEYDEDAEGVLLSDCGDGTFRIVTQEEHGHFSWLTLYLMGLIGPEEVRPVHILEGLELDPLGRVTADSVTTVTIDELMSTEGGERMPSYPDTQKNFTMAFIFVSDREYTPAEFKFFSLVAQYYSSEAPFSPFYATFYNATRGRGRMVTSLPDPLMTGESVYPVEIFSPVEIQGEGWYPLGEDVVLVAPERIFYSETAELVFQGWSGDIDSDSNEISLTIDGAKSLTANYELMGESGALKASISGIVYYSTTPMDGFTVCLVDEHDFDNVIQSTTTLNGHYLLSSVKPGRYYVTAYDPTTSDVFNSGLYSPIEITENIFTYKMDIEISKLFNMIAPSNQSIISDLRPSLYWEPVEYASEYRGSILTSSDWGDVDRFWVESPTYTLSQQLTPGVEYTWHVYAFDENGACVGFCREDFYFTVANDATEDTSSLCYLVEVESPIAVEGIGWYAPGETAKLEASETYNFGNDTRLVFERWSGDFGSSESSISFTVVDSVQLKAHYRLEDVIPDEIEQIHDVVEPEQEPEPAPEPQTEPEPEPETEPEPEASEDSGGIPGFPAVSLVLGVSTTAFILLRKRN